MNNSDRCRRCDSEARWAWHDGMFGGGNWCTEHIREKLDPEDNLPEYQDPVTTKENVTTLQNGSAVIPAGARPRGRAFPTIRTKEALDRYVNTDATHVPDS